MKEIFKTYQFSDDNAVIIEDAYWLLGNLACDCAKARDQFLDAKFLQHVSFLLSDKEFKLLPKTINILAYVISRFVQPKITNSADLDLFGCVLEPLKALLFVEESDTVDLALMSYSKLFTYASFRSQMYMDLTHPEILKQVVEIGTRSNEVTLKNVLRVLCDIFAGSNENIHLLVEYGVAEVILDATMDASRNLDKEVI